MSKRPPYPNGFVREVFNKRRGKCWYCDRRIAWIRYGDASSPFGWHVEHLKAVSKGGHAAHRNNVVPACIPCNLEKGTRTSRTQLRRKGRTRGPLTSKERNSLRTRNGAAGAAIGAGFGSVFGPGGTIVGGTIGAGIGSLLPVKDPGIAKKTRCKAKTKAGKECRNWTVPGAYGRCRRHR